LKPRRGDYRATPIQLRFPKYERQYRNVEIACRNTQSPRIQVGGTLRLTGSALN